MDRNGTTNSFHAHSRKSNIFMELSPAKLFILLTLCIYLCAWAFMLCIFRYTFSYTIFSNLKYSLEFSMTVLCVSQVIGMLSHWFLVKARLPVAKSLLIVCIICFAGSLLLFFLQQRYILYMLIVLFFLFGLLVAITTSLFQQYLPKTKRFFNIGLVLVSNSVISCIMRFFSTTVSLISLFVICLFATLLIAVLAVFLYTKPLSERNVSVISVRGKGLNLAYLHLLIYISTVSFIKGILFQSIPVLFLECSSIASVSLSVGYIVCIIVFTRFVKKRHLGISVYISNSIFLFSFICFMGCIKTSWLSVIFAAVIYATFALNDLFSFDLLFAFGDRYADSSNIFGFGFGVYLFSIYLGQITALHVQTLDIFQIELLIIFTYSIATFVLPFLRLKISKLLLDSSFRVNSILITPEIEQQEIKINELPINNKILLEPNHSAQQNNDLLSRREKEVLDLLLKGYPNDLIASALYISNNTLKKHIQNIYNKLGVHSRSELFLLMKHNAQT